MTTPTTRPGLLDTLAKYRKAIGTIAVTVGTFLWTLLSDGRLTADEAVLLAGVAVSVLNTALVPELDAGIGRVAKTASTALLAGLAVLAAGTLSPDHWVQAIVAGLAAIGVTAIPNAWPPATRPAPGIQLPEGRRVG